MRFVLVMWTDEPDVWKLQQVVPCNLTDEEALEAIKVDWEKTKAEYKITTYDAEFRITHIEVRDDWLPYANTYHREVTTALAHDEVAVGACV